MAEVKTDRKQALELAISTIERQFGKGSVMRLGAGGPLIPQPDTGEQALEITETLVRSNAVDVIVIDSVAALVPRAELDGDMGDSLPGLQARLMSQALRKLTAAISRSGAVVVFINQIREKIGVMFGCLEYDTQVVLADGRREAIGRIVEQRLPVDVLSYDPLTGRIEPRRVLNWFDNGETDSFVHFEVAGGHRFAATENHLIFTPGGEVKAGDLQIGDDVLVMEGSGAAPAKIIGRTVRVPARSTHRFDLEVEGQHTYLADGVVVHNSPETTTGGRALKFYASIRLDIRRQDAIKIGTESVGVRTKVKVVKNKLAPPFREAEFGVMYGEGISKSGTVLDAGVEQGIIEKSGTWYSYKNERIGQGRDNARKWLQENANVLADLEAKIRETLGLRAPAPLKS